MEPIVNLAKEYGPLATVFSIILTLLVRFGSRLSELKQQCAGLGKGVDEERTERRSAIAGMNGRLDRIEAGLQEMQKSGHKIETYLSVLLNLGLPKERK